MNFFTKFSVIFMTLTIVKSDPIPSSLKVCHKSDYDFNNCIERTLKGLQNSLRSGNLGNGITFTPLNVINMKENIRYDYDDVSVEVTKIKIFGADKFTIEQVESSQNPFEVKVVVKYNSLSTSSEYEISAPTEHFNGRGEIKQTIAQLRQKFIFKFGKTNDGKMKVDKLVVKILEARIGETKFSPRGNANKVFMEIVAEHVDQNGDDIFNEIKPVSERSSEKFYLRLANEILNNFSYDDLLPL
ncbi:unnamed protein product [Chironomus riparius]|uniref:Uncharacterized protein n=1 Tax=Chironomus riparius TaxID=315576 RepID=A0A9N9RNG1_9DIPT|nr:unnamed protein product [Chironomus riparius]